MVIVDVQRAGPSTGMPTKTEQADLLLAMFGRHGESPLPIVAASSPSDCFDGRHGGGPDRRALPDAGDPAVGHVPVELSRAVEAARESSDLPTIDPNFADAERGDGFLPYARDERLARPWAVPGTPGLVHRIGGLEREDGTGNISYDPENHERMTHLRPTRSTGSPTTSRRSRSTTPTATPSCWCWLGLDARHDPRRRRARARARPQGRHRAPAATSTRSPPTPARSCARYPRC